MPLPLFPIGTQPMQSRIAAESQKKGATYFVLLILIFLQIQGEDDNECNSLLTIALDMIVLLGLQTLFVAVPENRPCCNRPACPNRPPCNLPNPPKQCGPCICSVDAGTDDGDLVCPQEPCEAAQVDTEREDEPTSSAPDIPEPLPS